MASPSDILEALADGLGFTVEPTQYSANRWLVKRPSQRPGFKTEYANLHFDGDVAVLIANDEVRVLLADPKSIEQLEEAVARYGFLMVSHKPLDTPLSNRLLIGVPDED